MVFLCTRVMFLPCCFVFFKQTFSRQFTCTIDNTMTVQLCYVINFTLLNYYNLTALLTNNDDVV